MATRLTIRIAQAKCDNVNRLLGFDPDAVTWNTVGAIRLQGQYGGTAVHRVGNEQGGVSDLMGTSTLREVCAFLDGMRQALHYADR